MGKSVIIYTERFELKELALDDVTERYLNWFTDSDAARFISSASKTSKLADLKEYVSERINREDILFLGIFTRNAGLHIGNIKYEPVDSDLGYAIMGILIGDPEWRNKGVTAEVLHGSANWLKKHRNIKQVVLGVSRDNPAAVAAYQKAGFAIENTPYINNTARDIFTMVWHLEK